MGFRFQKRIKIAPGARLNVSKRGLGVSAGPRGATISTGPNRGAIDARKHNEHAQRELPSRAPFHCEGAYLECWKPENSTTRPLPLPRTSHLAVASIYAEPSRQTVFATIKVCRGMRRQTWNQYRTTAHRNRTRNVSSGCVRAATHILSGERIGV